ncbi:arylsulfatase [Sphingobacterium sp. SGR-19]|uniref:arylsulfatase n=1 Tax=Sphingobacterium sp. SGR-19 TaxID=2710886 RepID=UPI0013ECA5E1|nr:arylsulfatase [Sphingobacterium sp. SGR-19]NGM65530.1 arylsulfatase [Sphingobacterium sp. SGR-19]
MKTIILNVSSILFFVCSIIGSAFAQSKVAAKRPNIIVILADDLGYSDLGCYGGEINTPNLDWLASQGVRSTSFYNASRCCPTRASLLTGLYPHTAGIGNMTTDQKAPGYRGQLTSNTVTIAQVLKDAGYQTGMVGKWHVSETKPLPEKEEQLRWLDHQIQDKAFADTSSYPTHKGFQKYYGNIWGVVDFFDPFSLVNGTTPVKNVPADFYYTNVLGDSAVAYIDYFAKNGDPFFMYVAFTAPHWPLQALEKDIQKYEDTYKKGWEHIRTQRYQKMIHLGMINPKQIPLSDFMHDGKTWENNPDSIWDARAMAVHAAMVDCLDQNVGKLIDQLKKTGELENTFIMFLSDNGASPERPEEFGPGYDRSGTTRNGEKVSFSVNKDVLPGSQTTHMGIGRQWANAINTPFRYWKAKEHEGGINTPFIAYWPQGINSTNKFNRVPAHIIDLMATCIEVSGASYPQTFEGNTITPSPGKSLLPVLNGKITNQLHDELFWEHNGAAALRQGDWKIVRLEEKADWELYNLAVDRTETNNLAKKFPARVSQMKEKWHQLANQYQVFPKPAAQ